MLARMYGLDERDPLLFDVFSLGYLAPDEEGYGWNWTGQEDMDEFFGWS